jgi:1-acyl-sn-glycerol-3-phosphate acyltransferase
MLYYILRPLTRIALKAYFRKITINGLENLPKDKPVLLCSNHPTGFIEPCLMACFLPRVLHFLVRGDLFERPVLKHILISTNQIPIYRFRDGYEKLRNNRDVMNLSYDKLAMGEAILIFPEASTTEVKYLRPIKKGAARMAIETMKLHPDIDLAVVPIGINYSMPNRWRSFVNINIGKAIIPKLPEDEKEVPREIVRLTDELDKKLSELLLVKNKEISDDHLTAVLDVSQWQYPVSSSVQTQFDQPEHFEMERKISENLHEEQKLDFLHPLGEQPYLLEEGGVRWWDILISLILLLPVFILLLVNAIPVIGGVAIRNKYVREREFIASIAVAASLGLYMILFPIVFALLAFYKGWWALLLLFLPIGGLWGLVGMDYIRKVFYNLSLQGRMTENERQEIFDKGTAIIDNLINPLK